MAWGTGTPTRSSAGRPPATSPVRETACEPPGRRGSAKSTAGAMKARLEGGLIVGEPPDEEDDHERADADPGTGVMDEAVRRYRDEMDSEPQPVFDRLHRLIVAMCLTLKWC